jgi:hypothetical protein
MDVVFVTPQARREPCFCNEHTQRNADLAYRRDVKRGEDRRASGRPDDRLLNSSQNQVTCDGLTIWSGAHMRFRSFAYLFRPSVNLQRTKTNGSKNHTYIKIDIRAFLAETTERQSTTLDIQARRSSYVYISVQYPCIADARMH